MPKPRVIDSGFFDDLDIAQLTRDERLLMIAIVSRCADDYGRLIAHPAYLRKQAFGYDEDISIDDVSAMRGHILENCRNVLLYESDGQEYICLTNWGKYQKIRYHVSSKLPAPPQECPEPSPQIDGKLPVISCESDAEVTVNSSRVGLGSVEKGCSSVGLSSAETHDNDVDLEFRKLGNAWAAARGGLVNPLDSEELHALRDEYTFQWVYDAIIEANSARSRGRSVSLNFVKAILTRWHQEGRDTPYDHQAKATEAVKAEVAERDQRKVAEWEASQPGGRP